MVALATSVNGTVVAAARENGAIELWNVAPGAAGWHCLLVKLCPESPEVDFPRIF